MESRTRSGIILPTSIADAEPPKFRCALCPATFKAHEAGAYERHVKACSDRHEDAIRAMSPRTRLPGVFGDVGFDTELENWTKRHAEEIVEGRKRM